MAQQLTKDEQMQQLILSAAQKLFQQYGKQRVSMEDVAQAVGKGRSSLYYYYKNKEDVWDAVLELEFEEIVQKIKQAVDIASTPLDKIKAFCLTKIKMLRSKRELYHITTPLSNNLESKRPNYAKRHKYLKKESIILTEIFNHGIETGELRSLKPEEVDTLAFVLLGGLHGLEKEMSMTNNYTTETAIGTLCDVIMFGLKA